MTIAERCIVCKSTDRRRMIELAWNDGMAAMAISEVLGGSPNDKTIMKHLKDHTNGEGRSRTVETAPVLPARERVLHLQQLQLDEVERRIVIAKQKAAIINKAHESDEDWVDVDWSEFYDIIGKDAQSAIGSILKTQGLADKRDKAQGDLKLGLFDAMSRAGLAPKALVGGIVAPMLPPGDETPDD